MELKPIFTIVSNLGHELLQLGLTLGYNIIVQPYMLLLDTCVQGCNHNPLSEWEVEAHTATVATQLRLQLTLP